MILSLFSDVTFDVEFEFTIFCFLVPPQEILLSGTPFADELFDVNPREFLFSEKQTLEDLNL